MKKYFYCKQYNQCQSAFKCEMCDALKNNCTVRHVYT